MRFKYCGILYLGVILFYLLRPSLPYFEYVINKEYIEKNLCVEKDNPDNDCHGKCYLHEQLNKQSETQDANTNNDNKIAPDKKMDDHLQGSLTLPGYFEYEVVLSGFYSVPGTTAFNSLIFVPPKF